MKDFGVFFMLLCFFFFVVGLFGVFVWFVRQSCPKCSLSFLIRFCFLMYRMFRGFGDHQILTSSHNNGSTLLANFWDPYLLLTGLVDTCFCTGTTFFLILISSLLMSFYDKSIIPKLYATTGKTNWLMADTLFISRFCKDVLHYIFFANFISHLDMFNLKIILFNAKVFIL